MNKLLRAGFLRLKKDKCFWIGMLCMFGFGIFAACSKYYNRIRYNETARLDDVLLIYVSYTGFASAIFCSMFTGMEYSDGTIRNKLIAGHFRSSVYLSNWMVSFAAAMLMAAAFLVSYAVPGFFLLEAPKEPLGLILFYVFVSIFTVSAYVSLFHMLAMSVTRRSVCVAVCMTMFIGLLILAMTIHARLEAPEFLPTFTVTMNGVEQENLEPNPHYLQPAARMIYQFFLDALPTGQGIELVKFSVPHPYLMMLYSSVISVITTVLGIGIFKRKNLK